jgi:hypothetical protein
MTTNALTVHGDPAAYWTLLQRQADVMIKSKFLPEAIDTKEKFIAIAMLADSLNIDRFIGMNTINVIKGKPTLSPQLMLALARQRGNMESFESTDDGETCTVTVKRKGEPAHVERFSMEDARKMNLADNYNWKKQPAIMRRWRCIAAALRVVFPDVILGFYTPEEMGADGTYNESTGDYEITKPAKTESREHQQPTKEPETVEDAYIVPWYEDPEKIGRMATILKTSFDGLTPEDAVALLGKPASEFETGKAFVDALKALGNKSVQPPANPPAPAKPADPEPATIDELLNNEFLPNFYISVIGGNSYPAGIESALEICGHEPTDTFQAKYPNIFKAQEDVRKAALAAHWGVVATEAKYKQSGDKKWIACDTALGTLVSFAGRTELLEDLGRTTDPDWAAVKNWQPGDDVKKFPAPIIIFAAWVKDKSGKEKLTWQHAEVIETYAF